jgi:hypothetical protein
VVTTLAEDPTDLAWYVWDVGEPDTGWNLHLAVEHPADGLAWAITATDQSLL